ncbi:MAG TPA: ComEC/Rec2 family competence protein [Candidatus Enterenecus stercoripullorum]|nr:ComEC/Rec2 family competence protein [Candidatus Enterenecus stercoripullorum]
MRRLTWFSGGFAIVCLLACYGLGGPLSAILTMVLGFGALVVWRFTRLKKNEHPNLSLLSARRRRLLGLSRRLLALCLGGVLAWGWFAAYAALFYAPAQALAGTDETISGTVSSYPEQTSIGGWSMTLRLDGDFRAPDVLLYGSEEWGDLKPGDKVTCQARLEGSTRMYGAETTYYTAKGVFLIAYCNEPPLHTEIAKQVPLIYWPDLCARYLKAGIYAAFDPAAAPLAAAVTIGNQDGLDEALSSALNRSGILHAVVVSGMHISFLVGVLLFLCRGRRGVVLALVPLLFFFALMSGGAPSSMRAVIMQTVLLAGPVLRREGDMPTSLGLALLLLLAQNPFAAASISLQLSFGSVLGIVLAAAPLNQVLLNPFRARLKGKATLPARVAWQACRWVSANVSVSLAAMLFTTPMLALYFQQIPLIAPLTNILTLWAVTALTIAGLFLGVLGIFLPGLAAIPGAAVGLLAHYIRWIVLRLGSWPLACLDAENPQFQLWLAAAYLHLPAILLGKRHGRRLAAAAVSLALLLGVAIGFNAWGVARADLTVTALDVGQGASTLLLSGDHAALVDCGGSGGDNPGDLAADQLAALGRNRLDLLVLTHLDDDHFNGVPQLFQRLDVAQVVLPDVQTHPDQLSQLRALARQEGAELTFVEEDILAYPLGHAQLTLYPPMGQGTSNEEGLFALCSVEDFDLLITGDADAFVERMLVKYQPLPDLELLMVGHHGSAGSTDSMLLDRLRPELAIISVGYNSYGHPAQDTLDRLEQAGAQVYRTDQSGSITVTVTDGLVSIH